MSIPANFPPERNAQVHEKHRHEVKLHIYLPVIIGLVLILAGVIAIIIYGFQAGSSLRRWADVSLIWVIVPAMFIGLVLMLVTVAALYGVTRLLGILPGYSRIVQGYFNQAGARVSQVTNTLVEPVLKARSSWAVVKHRNRVLTNHHQDR